MFSKQEAIRCERVDRCGGALRSGFGEYFSAGADYLFGGDAEGWIVPARNGIPETSRSERIVGVSSAVCTRRNRKKSGKARKIGARREGFLADELTAQDANLAAFGGIGGVEDFYFRSAAYQQEFFVRYH